MPYPFELNDSRQKRVRHHTPEQFDHMRQPYRLRALRRASGGHAGHICSPLSSLSAIACYRLKGASPILGNLPILVLALNL
jgi:hypothetical protein